MKRTTEIKEDPLTGDLYIEIDPTVWDELGWKVGDDVVWEEQYQQQWVIRKKDDTTLDSTE